MPVPYVWLLSSLGQGQGYFKVKGILGQGQGQVKGKGYVKVRLRQG